MILSHSKLQTILNNPMDYYLSYRLGIKPKETKPYFLVGSAVHWGLEHDTEDLSEYFKDKPNKEVQFQAEAMVHGYLSHKDEIMNEIFKDYESGELLSLLDDGSEFHELDINANLPSFIHPNKPHKFIGIIDLLYLTSKGFILIDYKTSSVLPDYDKYLDQLYRYIFELNSVFPDTPVYKIGIVNLIKSKIKQLKNESNEAFMKRYQEQYEKGFNHLINVHMFDPKIIDKTKMQDYLFNLSKAADLAETIDNNNLFWYNDAGARSPYPSVYLDIYNDEPGCFVNYEICDLFYNEDLGKIVQKRDCTELDMEVIKHNNVMNKYDLFKKEVNKIMNQKKIGIDDALNYLKQKFICDDYLLKNYYYIYINKLDNNEPI